MKTALGSPGRHCRRPHRRLFWMMLRRASPCQTTLSPAAGRLCPTLMSTALAATVRLPSEHWPMVGIDAEGQLYYFGNLLFWFCLQCVELRRAYRARGLDVDNSVSIVDGMCKRYICMSRFELNSHFHFLHRRAHHSATPESAANPGSTRWYVGLKAGTQRVVHGNERPA